MNKSISNRRRGTFKHPDAPWGQATLGFATKISRHRPAPGVALVRHAQMDVLVPLRFAGVAVSEQLDSRLRAMAGTLDS
jgi:hypothetical protein